MQIIHQSPKRAKRIISSPGRVGDTPHTNNFDSKDIRLGGVDFLKDERHIRRFRLAFDKENRLWLRVYTKVICHQF